MHERRMAGRTGRAVARPGRVARTHAPRVLLAAVALFVALLQVGTAYALPGSELNGYPLGEILMSDRLGEMRATCVYGASNEFFATLCLIGRKSDYLQLSPQQLSELSGEGTGGAFYELSQRWNNYAADGGPTNDDGYPIGFRLAIDGQSLISDPAYIWYADYSYYDSDSLYQRALDDYLTIYNGGHLGGGTANQYTLSCTDNGVTRSSNVSESLSENYMSGSFGGVLFRPNGVYKGTTTFPRVAPDFDVAFSSANVNGLLATDGMKLYVTAEPRYSFQNINGTSIYRFTSFILQFVITDCEPVRTTSSYTYSGTTFSVEKLAFTRSGSQTLVTFTVRNSSEYSFDGHTMTVNSNPTISNSSSASIQTPASPNSGDNTWSNFGASGGGGGGGGGTWPEPDPTPQPDPPDVPEPEPRGPDVEPPDPYMPIVDPPSNPDPVTDPYVVVVAPDSQDIIPWLRAILQAINNLGDKLNAESTELQNALNKTFFNNLSKLLRNLKGEFIQDYTSWLDHELEWFNSEIHDYFVDLQTYLYHLFEWLADQMNFEVNLETDPYDDTSLLNWLRRIYNKLGADGGPNTRPVDPSTDPEGFLDWLRRVIAEFILGLGASASDFVSDLGDLLSRLFAKFPFSVPWDLLGILGLLDAAPVAPRANFTIPLTIGNQEFSWTVDINLQGWSVYMESVRTIILVSFISWLAWLTPNVLRDLDPGDFL